MQKELEKCISRLFFSAKKSIMYSVLCADLIKLGAWCPGHQLNQPLDLCRANCNGQIGVQFGHNSSCISWTNPPNQMSCTTGCSLSHRTICFRNIFIRALSAHSAAEFNILPSRWQHIWLVAIVPPVRWGKMDRNDCHTAWGNFKTLLQKATITIKSTLVLFH
jgi:hypothetical protein